MRGLTSLVLLLLPPVVVRGDSPVAPSLEWVRILGGSGGSRVAAAAADLAGNLYLTGSTGAMNFPTAGSGQNLPGGSPLYRIDPAGSAALLFPPGLSAITAFAASPRDVKTLFAASGASIWRSDDSGASWTTLATIPDAFRIWSIAPSASDPRVMYAGSGPNGLYKSVDGGQTWLASNEGLSPTSAGALNVYQVWIDPFVADVVFISTELGLWRSDSAGAAWVRVATAHNDPPMALMFSGSAIYASVGGQVLKSTDDGATFAVLSALPDLSSPTSLIADPFNAGVFYAGSGWGVYRSADAGATWTRVVSGQCASLAADANRPMIYASMAYANGVIRSSDGFQTSTPVGPPVATPGALTPANGAMFVVTTSSSDGFVTKLDPDGAIVYSTYLGGSGSDSPAAIATASDGSVYVAGTTYSRDFPVTPGVYATSFTSTTYAYSNFIAKLRADGSLAWSSFFANGNTTILSIAVDAQDNPVIAGSTSGQLPVTPGAYQTTFQRAQFCGFFCMPGPTSAFVTKFKSDGTGLVYSTYVAFDSANALVQDAQSIALDGDGRVYIAGTGRLVLLDASGSALLAATSRANVTFNALALDAEGNVYGAGSVALSPYTDPFPATDGAFQKEPRPGTPSLPLQPYPGGGSDAIVMKWDAALSRVQAATLLGGESYDSASSVAIGRSGEVIVSGTTDSKSFPTSSPFQTSFSPRSGFVAAFDPNLSTLRYSTYLGDRRPFEARLAIADRNGDLLVAGSMLTAGSLFLANDPGATFNTGDLVAANKIRLLATAAPRLDTVVNAASHLAAPLAPGEAVVAQGSGFGANAKLLLDGVEASIVSRSATALTAVAPAGLRTSGTVEVRVSSDGADSNTVLAPAAVASPGVYSRDGSGYGAGWILNSDGTFNSADNPAAAGSAITIYATGAGAVTIAGGSVVTPLAPAVFVDGFYARGVGSASGPVDGLPGDVYRISVYVPDPAAENPSNPNLVGFKLPSQVGLQLVFGAVNALNPANSDTISQLGVVLYVK